MGLAKPARREPFPHIGGPGLLTTQLNTFLIFQAALPLELSFL
jgi:hypothetical protein